MCIFTQLGPLEVIYIVYLMWFMNHTHRHLTENCWLSLEVSFSPITDSSWPTFCNVVLWLNGWVFADITKLGLQWYSSIRRRVTLLWYAYWLRRTEQHYVMAIALGRTGLQHVVTGVIIIMASCLKAHGDMVWDTTATVLSAVCL